MRIVYLLLFVGILVFVTACSDCEVAHYDNGFVVCQNNVFGKSVPIFMANTTTGPVRPTQTPTDFNSDEYDCSHEGSPAQPKSAKPIYPNLPPLPGPGLRPKPNASSPMSYLRSQVLALPFVAFESNNTPPPCDPSSPDVLQVNHPNAKVTRLSTCPFSIKATIPVVSRPLQIDITPDGLTALVTSFDNAVNFIDLRSNQVVFTLKTDFNVNPDGIAITPDGTRAYITSFNQNNPVVQVIDIASRAVTATINVNAYPQGAFVTPDGSQIYVTFPLGGAVYVIDTLTNTIAAGLNIQAPYGVAFNSTGSRAYITSAAGNGGGTVQVVDTATFSVIKSYPVGATPVDIDVTYGDRFVIVNNSDGNSVSVIDTISGTVKTTALQGSLLGLSVVRQ
jgi:YVTN family beta-propeller protein